MTGKLSVPILIFYPLQIKIYSHANPLVQLYNQQNYPFQGKSADVIF